MSLFLIAAEQSAARSAAGIWQGLYGQAVVERLRSGLWAARSSGYQRQAANPGDLMLLGTAFDSEGFHDSAGSRLRDPWSAEETQGQLHGHWIAVASDDSRTLVYTDPIGMLNVFYATEPQLLVSNSMTTIAALLPTALADPLGVLEFVTKESGIAARTHISGVRRLRFQHQLELSTSALVESPLAHRVPERLDEGGYRERIQRYFELVARFPGRVGVELSAGFDTRLVAACASRSISGLGALSNENRRDGGVDLLFAKTIAERLGLPLSVCFREETADQAAAFLHATNGGRNVLRSTSDLGLARSKYEAADLVLGGYGGEVVRASYAKFGDLQEHVLGYYARKAWLDKNGLLQEFVDGVTEDLLRDYDQPWISGPRQRSQWLYAVDRMRIWGGARSHLMALHGDQLHPFMDWYLLEPLLAWQVEELDGARLAGSLIEHFAPALKGLAFNPKLEELSFFQRKAAKKLARAEAYDPGVATPDAAVSDALCEQTGISREAARKLGDGVGLDRLATVQLVLDLAGTVTPEH